MEAKLMLVSSKQKQDVESNRDQCVCIDDSSMGSPHTDFGKLLNQQVVIDDKLISKVKVWFDVLERKEYLNLDEIIKWLEAHRGEYVETQCWDIL